MTLCEYYFPQTGYGNKIIIFHYHSMDKTSSAYKVWWKTTKIVLLLLLLLSFLPLCFSPKKKRKKKIWNSIGLVIEYRDILSREICFSDLYIVNVRQIRFIAGFHQVTKYVYTHYNGIISRYVNFSYWKIVSWWKLIWKKKKSYRTKL